MKRFFVLLISLLCMVMLISSCGKDEVSEDNSKDKISLEPFDDNDADNTDVSGESDTPDITTDKDSDKVDLSTSESNTILDFESETEELSTEQENYELTDDEIRDKYAEQMSDAENPIALIIMEDGGRIVLELYPSEAPNTVNNFIYLANSGFYDGVIFHRVIPGFMIQGGDPDGIGTGGPGYEIFGEFSNNGFDNELKHVRGTLSMARKGNLYDPASAYNTAGSQFFIMVQDVESLDGDYAAFGFCIDGMDVVDRIVSSERDISDKPLEDMVMSSVRVYCGAKKYDIPEKIG